MGIIMDMTKNPVINALTASIYIFLVVGLMNVVTQYAKDKPDTFMAPVLALFMLTLSASVMAYLFFYQPLLFVLDGKKKEAISLFVKTVGAFGVMTIIVLGFVIFVF